MGKLTALSMPLWAPLVSPSWTLNSAHFRCLKWLFEVFDWAVAVMCQVPAMRVSERLEAAGFVRSDWSWESDLPNQALQPHRAGNTLRGTETGLERTLALL